MNGAQTDNTSIAFSGDNADPFGVECIVRTGQIAPQAFDREAAGDQLGADGFRGVILEPVAVNADFAVALDDDGLVEEKIVRVGKTLFQNEVRPGLPETLPGGVPAVFQAVFLTAARSGDVQDKTAAGYEGCANIGEELGPLLGRKGTEIAVNEQHGCVPGRFVQLEIILAAVLDGESLLPGMRDGIVDGVLREIDAGDLETCLCQLLRV